MYYLTFIVRGLDLVRLNYVNIKFAIALAPCTACSSAVITFITVTSKWAWWRLKSPATRLFTQPFIQAKINKTSNSASLAFVQRIHRCPVNSPHKGPVTRKMFPFDDVIMKLCQHHGCNLLGSLCRLFVSSHNIDILKQAGPFIPQDKISTTCTCMLLQCKQLIWSTNTYSYNKIQNVLVL